MSRRSAPTPFASRGAFDILGDDVEDQEEEVEEEEEITV